jgi:hypothetical protein
MAIDKAIRLWSQEWNSLSSQSANVSVGDLVYEKLKLVALSDELPFKDPDDEDDHHMQSWGRHLGMQLEKLIDAP